MLTSCKAARVHNQYAFTISINNDVNCPSNTNFQGMQQHAFTGYNKVCRYLGHVDMITLNQDLNNEAPIDLKVSELLITEKRNYKKGNEFGPNTFYLFNVSAEQNLEQPAV